MIWDHASERYCEPQLHYINLGKALDRYSIPGYSDEEKPDLGAMAKLDVRRCIWPLITAQSVPSLVHACRESRSRFIMYTKTEFRFGTYMNMELGLMYIPGLEVNKFTFANFLRNEDVKVIENLAMPKSLFLGFPWIDPTEAKMRQALKEWRGVIVVFGYDHVDGGLGYEHWKRGEVGLVPLNELQSILKEPNFARTWAEGRKGMAKEHGQYKYRLEYEYVSLVVDGGVWDQSKSEESAGTDEDL